MTTIDTKYDVSSQLVSLNNESSWIETYTGRKIFPLNPDPDEIDILDIAHALSNLCRYTGHCREFLSVAQHSVMVSYICDEKDALAGALHDSSEAYIADISKPLKSLPEFSLYRLIEARLQTTIYKKFGLDPIEPPGVKRADQIMLATEARDLMPPHKDWHNEYEPLPFRIESWEPIRAEKEFLKRFNALYGS